MFKPAFIGFLLITLCLPLRDYPASAQPATDYQPSVGQEGKDVIWVPTPQALVDKMLDMANRKWQAAIRRRDAQRSKSWYR